MSETEAAAATAVVAVACVPDVIISNILERVPDLVSLFRCSLVCKEWRGLVADPAFLRRRGIWPEPEGRQSQLQSSSSLVGIFVQRDRPLRANSRPRKISKRFPTRAPAFLPAQGSVLGPQLRFLTSFIRDAGDGILDDATPLAARDGLLLVRVWRPRSTDKNSGGGVLMRLCVCNLLTGKCDLLPALDVDATFNADGVRGYALLTAADNHGAAGPHDGRCPVDGFTTLFQVLLVGRRHAEHLVCRFSSASGDWNALDCRQPNLWLRARELHGLWGPYCRVPAVARGTAHWFFLGGYGRSFSFYTLDVSAGTGRVSMTALPVDAVAAIVGAAGPYRPWWLWTSAEESLALLCVKGNNRLVMMKQRQRDDGDQWDSGHVAQVDLDVELGFGRESLSPVCIGDRSGTALALYHSDPECAYVLDLASGSATKLEGWIRSFNYMTAVPCEINWEIFFVSRLGVKL